MELNENEITDIKRSIEAALLASSEPLSIQDIKRMFNDEVSVVVVKDALVELAGDWLTRSGELV